MGQAVRLGSLSLLVLSDGILWLDAGLIFGAVPRAVWEPLIGPLDPLHRMPMGLNSLLVRSRGKNILIDTGVGDKLQEPPGLARLERSTTLLEELARHGLTPEEVDIVINTHLHYDHAGGNTRRQGEEVVPTFPRARYLIARGEWEAATHPNERTRPIYLAEDFLPLAERGQVELFEGEKAVTPEVTIIPTPGHTADAVSVLITSGGEKALYLGTLASHPLHLERPAWISATDLFPLASLESKKRLIEMGLRDGLLFIVGHMPFPGLGRLALVEGRRRWVALEL